MTMRIVSFNVNGIRSMHTKHRNGDRGATAETSVMAALLRELAPDFLCLQEIKTDCAEDCLIPCTDGSYHVYVSSAAKKGYSGVAILSREAPLWIEASFDRYHELVVGDYRAYDFYSEGRILVARYAEVCVVNVYVPNAKPGLARIEERLQWEKVFRAYLRELREEMRGEGVGVVVCGDLNCAVEEMDIHSPATNRGAPGFSDQERGAMRALLMDGWTDTFRALHPSKVAYSYFSNFAQSRAKNKGWRIDYVLASDLVRAEEAAIHGEYYGSDHCPVRLDFTRAPR
jgi:exodeoxyribonuclease-3